MLHKFLIIVSLVGIITSSVEVIAKGITFKGKGKLNEAVGREALCRSICSDSHNPEEFLDPWNETHQICACWDETVYRTNIEKYGCKTQKDLPVFILSGQIYTCNRMCKKFLSDLSPEASQRVQVRKAFMCNVKMMYGYTSTCICDFKFS